MNKTLKNIGIGLLAFGGAFGVYKITPIIAPKPDTSTFKFTNSNKELNLLNHGFATELCEVNPANNELENIMTDTAYHNRVVSLHPNCLIILHGGSSHCFINNDLSGYGFSGCNVYTPSTPCGDVKLCTMDGAGCKTWNGINFYKNELAFAKEQKLPVIVCFNAYNDYTDIKKTIDLALTYTTVIGIQLGAENNIYKGYANAKYFGSDADNFATWGVPYFQKFAVIIENLKRDYKGIKIYNDIAPINTKNQDVKWNGNVKALNTDGGRAYWFDEDLNTPPDSNQSYAVYRDYVLKLGDSCVAAKKAAYHKLNNAYSIGVMSYGNSSDVPFINTFLWWMEGVVINIGIVNNQDSIDWANQYRFRAWQLWGKNPRGDFYLFQKYGAMFTDQSNLYKLTSKNKYFCGFATKTKAVLINLGDTDVPISISIDGKAVSPLTVTGYRTDTPLTDAAPIEFNGGTIFPKYSITIITY